MEDVKTASSCRREALRLIVWLQLQQIMHGMKIDVKRKIYLVSIDKIDNNNDDVHDSAFCCRLLSALPKISSVIRRHSMHQMRMILVIIMQGGYHRGLGTHAASP
ncbi:hypothetical protein [Janthinobacterium sp. PSPC1-1]|uniref:hypothetical protein n=1 Tax=Janthinobacterium sp. PSPC1-1 TaxID=2804581 RepID=UPI003CFAE78B